MVCRLGDRRQFRNRLVPPSCTFPLTACGAIAVKRRLPKRSPESNNADVRLASCLRRQRTTLEIASAAFTHKTLFRETRVVPRQTEVPTLDVVFITSPEVSSSTHRNRLEIRSRLINRPLRVVDITTETQSKTWSAPASLHPLPQA
jgi:hypothetical protein